MHKFPLVSKIRINRARSEFFSQGILPAGLISDSIARSWQRSVANGVKMERDCSFIPTLTSNELQGLTEKNRSLLLQSIPVMENLFEQIHDTSSMVILADAAGVVLHSLGDPCFVDRARKVSLQPGGIWSEQLRGTNAIGTALLEQKPVLVHSSEHFIASNHFLTCSASPIFDPYGKLLGALDVSSDCRAYQRHTMALVRISAQQIENQMFSNGFESDIVLQFHNRPEFIGTMYEAIAVFARDGSLLAANRSALLHLGLDRYRAKSKTFSELFDLQLDVLLANAGIPPQPVLQAHLHSGVKVYCRAKVSSSSHTRTITREDDARTSVPIQRAERNEIRNLSLDSLEFGDARMRCSIDKVRKVLGHDIPVMLEGESGTGKELFANAMHLSGSRRNGPFVALNCAALPESLIESELFGYQEGAFTGARRKGNIGKIRQADGGTLFLDEIGDMPLPLQARLLRVLQERTINPLGDTSSYRVDIAVVCATNRKLRNEIAAGRFREDLYYRLNGLLITLPSLREREDLLPLAQSILKEIAGSGRMVRLTDNVLDIFASHPWPGNVRQLHNVLRTAVALLGTADEITMEYLPEDFLEQHHENGSQSSTADPAVADTSFSDVSLSLDHLEIQAIRNALQDCGGNVTAASRRLGISRNTLYRKTRGMAFTSRILESSKSDSRHA
jgi:transcriptional regulator of acetoin/glycerol metabolism